MLLRNISFVCTLIRFDTLNCNDLDCKNTHTISSIVYIGDETEREREIEIYKKITQIVIRELNHGQQQFGQANGLFRTLCLFLLATTPKHEKGMDLFINPFIARCNQFLAIHWLNCNFFSSFFSFNPLIQWTNQLIGIKQNKTISGQIVV